MLKTIPPMGEEELRKIFSRKKTDFVDDLSRETTLGLELEARRTSGKTSEGQP
jgi:hypothetical protein